MPWLIATIKARNEDSEAIMALLSRIVDPREYDGDQVEAARLVDAVNGVLAVDGYTVGLDGGRPFAAAVDTANGRAANERVAAALASPELRTTVRGLVRSQDLADILISRLDEVEAARNAGAYVLAIVGTGSFIEGLLDNIMKARDPDIRRRENTNLDLSSPAHTSADG